jgi:hypothetical protein
MDTAAAATTRAGVSRLLDFNAVVIVLPACEASILARRALAVLQAIRTEEKGPSFTRPSLTHT